MLSNDSTINVKTKEIKWINDNITFNTLGYITIYHTYWLLYCKRHIQMISNDSTVKMETKAIKWKNDKIAFKTLGFILQYTILPAVIIQYT